VKDAYSTDAKIEENNVSFLKTMFGFSQSIRLFFLFRSSMSPAAISALRRLEGTLDQKRMIHFNREAERTKNYTFAANLYLKTEKDWQVRG
jgi:glycine betaine/choline ABC-type transport system substrate-binding protein